MEALPEPKKHWCFCPIHRWQPFTIFLPLLVMLGLIGGLYQDVWLPLFSSTKSADCKSYLSEFYDDGFSSPESTVELFDDDKILFLYWIPTVDEQIANAIQPKNSFMIGSLVFHTSNRGELSIADVEMSSIYSKTLWLERLAEIERNNIVSLANHDFDFDVKHVGETIVTNRNFPDLHPQNAVPLPVFFRMPLPKTNGTAASVALNGDLQFRLFAINQPSFVCTFKFVAIHADTQDEFMNKMEGYVHSSRELEHATSVMFATPTEILVEEALENSTGLHIRFKNLYKYEPDTRQNGG
jgi:hypothetical protein